MEYLLYIGSRWHQSIQQYHSTWSTWPMMLLNYNLPPWLSTKNFFVLLALLIPVKQSVTSKVFDVYMEPLVDELLELWTSVATYDVTKPIGFCAFMLCAILLWTIHDFPGYGRVGGFAYHGYAGCSWYRPELRAEHFVELGKQTYGGTRRWLSENHMYRFAAMKEYFNGEVESHTKPRAISMEEHLQYAVEYEAWKEAGNRGGAAGDPSKLYGVKNTSILYRLPYWKVRQCDVQRQALLINYYVITTMQLKMREKWSVFSMTT
jgi:hypothetical protein